MMMMMMTWRGSCPPPICVLCTHRGQEERKKKEEKECKKEVRQAIDRALSFHIPPLCSIQMENYFHFVSPSVTCKLCGDLRGQDRNTLDHLLLASELEQELVSDLKGDISLLSEKFENGIADECLVHPSCDMSSTSIVTLASGRKDRFLELLRATHSHQKREAINPSISKKRVTLMDSNGLTETLEFMNEKAYWRFVYCIKSVYDRKTMNLRGFCTLTNSEIVQLSALESNTVEYVVYDTSLDIILTKGETHTMDLTVIRALALSADFGEYMPINLDISQFHCKWMDGSGDKITELLMRASYKSKIFGTITSGDVIVSDESFISLLLPNDIMTLLKFYVKYEKDDITLASSDADSAAVLGKLELSLHAFFAAYGGDGGDRKDERKISPVRKSFVLTGDQEKKRLDMLPLPLQVEIPLSSPDTDLVAKLIIYGGSDIPGITRQTIPNAYCVVYIKSRDGSIIEARGNKTMPIRSHDPQWNIEFFLHTRLGVAEIDSVLIKVKDASVGSLRARHIGQVELSAAVFVPTAAIAKLHLPLIATDRMMGAGTAQHDLGEIFVGTQVIKVPRAELVHGRLSFMSGGVSSSSSSSTCTISSRPLASAFGSLPEDEIPQGGVSNMKCVISHTPVSSVWWPCVSLASDSVLSARAGISASDETVVEHLECVLFPSYFMIRSRTDGGHCRKESSVAVVATVRTLQEEEAVRIPWTEVMDITTLTQYSVVITYRTHACTSQLADRRSQSIKNVRKMSIPYLSARSGRASFDSCQHADDTDFRTIDLVIGPCPSMLFERIVRDRMTTSGLRSSMRRLLTTNGTALPAAGAVSVFGDALSLMESCLRMMARDMQGQREVVNMSNGNGLVKRSPMTDASRRADCTVYAKPMTVRSGRMRIYLMMIMKQCSDIHARYFAALDANEVEAVLAEGLGRTLQGGNGHNISLESFEKRRKRWIDTIAAWKNIPIAIAGQGHEVNARSGSFDEDCLDGDDNECHAAVSTKAIITVVDDIVASCVRLVNITLLCCWKGASADRDGYDHLHTDLRDIISSHYIVISDLLGVFLSSNESFQRLRGQTNRTNFMKYLVVHDSQLAKLLQPSLSLVGLEVTPLPFLLGSAALKSAVHIYSRGLVAETRMWLSKTIHQAQRERQNTSNLPWDIELVGDKVISALPETLRFQMNPYTELVMESHRSLTSSPEGHRSLIHQVDETDMSESDRAMWQDIGLHEQILRAICKSLILLAQEYNLTLSSRHWELPSSQVMGQSKGAKSSGSASQSTRQDEDSENLMFLVAVANDSFRVSNIHLSELLRIDSAVDWSDNTKGLIQAVTKEFQQVSERSIQLIVRVVFADLLTILSNFNSLWLSHGNLQHAAPGTFVPPSPVMGIIATIQDYLCDIKTRIEPTLFFEVVCACADAAVIRYLIFLKSMAEVHHSFSSDDIARIQMDVMNLINAFRKFSEFEMHHYLNPLSRALSTLADAVFVIASATRNDENFIHAMKTLAHQKKNPTKEDGDTTREALMGLLSLSVAKLSNPATEAVEVTRLVTIAMTPLPHNSPLLRISSPSDGPLIRAFRTSTDASGGGASGGGKTRHGGYSSKGPAAGKKYIRMDDTELKRKMGLMDLARSSSNELRKDSVSKVVRKCSEEIDANGNPTSIMNVIISNIQSRGLVSKAVIGKANPYVVVSYEDQRVKTPVKWNTNNPEWNDVLRLTGVSIYSANKMIEVRVYDKERLARKTLLGAVTVSIDGVDLHPTKSWFALTGGEIGCGGEIYMNIKGERIS